MTGSVDGGRAVDVIYAGFMLKGRAVVMGEAEGKDRQETLWNSVVPNAKFGT